MEIPSRMKCPLGLDQYKGGRVIYWISDEDVFAPAEYADKDLQNLNKGQFLKVGEYDESQCTSNNEVIFEIK